MKIQNCLIGIICLININCFAEVSQFGLPQYPDLIQNNFDQNFIGINSYNTTQKPLDLPSDAASHTEIIQQALDNNQVVVLPDQRIQIAKEGLTLNSNNVLIFGKQTVLTIQPNNLKSYQVLRIKNVENVKVYNPKIIGDKHTHLGKSGEWGMGIAILGSKNIEIYNPVIQKTWGDGLYIGPSTYHSENVKIYNAIIDDARRNGISITSAKNVTIQNAIISNTDGTNPKAGIDIEPNNNKDHIENILLKDINTFKNKSHGIIISVSGLIGAVQKSLSITIDNHMDYQSKSGFAIGSTGKKSSKNGMPVSGFVKLTNANYIDNYYKGIEIYKSTYNKIDLQIIDPRIINGNKTDQKSIEEYKSKVKEYYK